MPSTVQIPTVNVIGTTTNNNAAAGEIGEYVESSVAVGSAVSLTSAVPANITSISLAAGDWDVSGVIGFNQNSATTITYLMGSSSIVSATVGGFPNETLVVSGICSAGQNFGTIPIPTRRLSLASTTTVYLVADQSFGVSTLAGFGAIRARRVR